MSLMEMMVLTLQYFQLSTSVDGDDVIDGNDGTNTAVFPLCTSVDENNDATAM